MTIHQRLRACHDLKTLQGQIPRTYVDQLLALSNIRSPLMLEAVYMYLLGGLSQTEAAQQAGLSANGQSLLSRKISLLNKIHRQVVHTAEWLFWGEQNE